MAALHSALKSLAPLDFSDVPTAPDELDAYISDIFTNSELIVESVPIPSPDDVATRSRSDTGSSVASSSSEMASSAARSAEPAPEHTALRKEWGKPYKLNAKENPLNISVYKASGKDGHGAWFARRSVHEGLGFARFKRGLEREFPEAMKVQGGPGEGSIRGIGGEKRVEEIHVDGKGRVEVYYLTAQFPGPTTPRDFVTLLVTSSKAMKESHKSEIPELSPRHYMIISKPCNHPECPPKEGLVRGNYESVEFIREVPRRPKKSMSSNDLSKTSKRGSGRHSPNLEHEALMRSAGQHKHPNAYQHENRSVDDLPRRSVDESGSSVAHSSSGRQRGATMGHPDGSIDSSNHRQKTNFDDYDPEANPVEWIMITRSDPGGGIPRFLVDRGTPGSIVADAYKFLDWATQQDEPAAEKNGNPRSLLRKEHRDSFESWQANGHLAGINEKEPVPSAPVASTEEPVREEDTQPATQTGILGTLSSTINAYAPQAVLDHLPGQNASPEAATEPFPPAPTSADAMHDIDNADASSISSASFASADSHRNDTDDVPSVSSSQVSPEKDGDQKHLSHHEKELQKLAQRRATLDRKLETTREKMAKDNENQTAKEKEVVKKAEEKHEKEVKKQEERYQRELRKLEQKKEKEAKKAEERQKKQADKDEKGKLTRERDEAREELDMLKREREIMQQQVGDLQRENTKLMARVGKLEGMDGGAVKALIDEEKSGHVRSRSGTESLRAVEDQRSRSSSSLKQG